MPGGKVPRSASFLCEREARALATDRQRKEFCTSMIGIVRIALQRPYTFVVMAMLILIFGVMA
ncbi:MAG: hypothetical protein WBD43_03800, partial [Methylovirgula sp.]